MADDGPPSVLLHNFNLPHGNDDTNDDAVNSFWNNDSMQDVIPTSPQHSGQHFIDYEKGFSDDEGYEEAFDRSFPGPKPSKKSPKGKKSPRRSDDDASPEQSPKSKKPRKQSLFSGPFYESDDDADDEISPKAPKTPGHGIGMRMSSLTLSQDGNDIEDNGEGSSRPRAHEAETLGLTDRRSRGNGSPALSDRSSNFGDFRVSVPDNVNPYELRKNVDRQIAPVTWLDVDQSGNYDPEEEARQKALKLKAAKAAAKAKKRKGKQKAAPKERILKCIVRLAFKAIGTVENITNREENWPDGWSDIDSEDERVMKEYRSRLRRTTPDRKPQIPIGDPAGEFEDLTGHPAARGCKDCRKHDQECSMVENGEWPCIQCNEDDIECHPIIEPKVKRRCNRCSQMGNGQSCSFEDPTVETQAICDECLDADCFECVSGPAEGYKAERIDLNQILYGPDRQFASCTFCRANKKRCSLKKKEDKPPCRSCKKNGIGCNFYELPPKPEKPKRGGKKKAITSLEQDGSGLEDIAPEVSIPNSDFFDEEDLADLEREDEDEFILEKTPEIEMEDGKGHRGIVTTLWTSFAHPMEFSTTPNGVRDCNFCELPVFGMTGYFEREAHVLKWYNGLGYTELAGGHRETYDATTMCAECTFNRLQIMACPGHEMDCIDDKSALQDFDSAATDLMMADPGSVEMQYQLQRWCSMCFSLATFRCCASQPAICAQDDDEQEIDGCGLRLCGNCEEQLKDIYGGNFQDMVESFEKEPKARKGDEETSGKVVVRADVGLLRVDGLLMKNVETGGEAMEAEAEAEAAGLL